MALPDHATIATVLNQLRRPEDYLCGVLLKLHAWRTASGGQDPYVTIGIMGDGKYPNYKLEGSLDVGWRPTQGFNGRSHTKLDGVGEADVDTWSTNLMTRAEVEALLGGLRSVRRKGIT